MSSANLYHFILLLLTQKETNFPPPFSFTTYIMIWKPSSHQRKTMNTPTQNHTIHHHKLKQQPHLSGAYIRTLVKHLTTSTKPKDSHTQHHDTTNIHQQPPPPPPSPLPSPPPPQPPSHKKQVRRRRHTNKPYQQRLLNMAEARREIVTALKFHRATMKHRETAGNHRPPEQSPTTTTTAAAGDMSCSYLEHYWPMTTATPPPPPPENQENLDFTLPDQTLGLNLNFQDFENLGSINLYHNPLSNHPTSSSSSCSSLPTTSSTSTSSSSTTSSSSSSSGAIMNGGLHHAMDDEGMEEIRSIGEQHQIEWNDTVNLLMSAQWFEFLKTIEIKQEDGRLFDDEINPFDQVMEFPPCMDRGEIEGMDGEWLA